MPPKNRGLFYFQLYREWSVMPALLFWEQGEPLDSDILDMARIKIGSWGCLMWLLPCQGRITDGIITHTNRYGDC